MKLHRAYAILIRTRVKVVTQVRIQSRWLIFAIFNWSYFFIDRFDLLQSIKSVDLSGYSVNQISLNNGFNQKDLWLIRKLN